MSGVKEIDMRRKLLTELQPQSGADRLKELIVEIRSDFTTLIKQVATDKEGSAIAMHRLLKRCSGFAVNGNDVLIMLGRRHLDGYNVGMPGQGIRTESRLRIVPEVEIRSATESLDEIIIPVEKLPELDETHNPVIAQNLILEAVNLVAPKLKTVKEVMYKVVFEKPGTGFLQMDERLLSYLIIHKDKSLASFIQRGNIFI